MVIEVLGFWCPIYDVNVSFRRSYINSFNSR